MRQGKDLGERKKPRVELGRRGFLIPTPGAAWIECIIVDVSDSGVCLDVGALVVGRRFALAFNTSGSVIRVCSTVWRRGELVGASFLSAEQLRGQPEKQNHSEHEKA